MTPMTPTRMASAVSGATIDGASASREPRLNTFHVVIRTDRSSRRGDALPRREDGLKRGLGGTQGLETPVPHLELLSMLSLEIRDCPPETRRESVHALSRHDGRHDRVFATNHEDALFPETHLVKRASRVAERIADEVLKDHEHTAHDVAVPLDPQAVRIMADQHPAVVEE